MFLGPNGFSTAGCAWDVGDVGLSREELRRVIREVRAVDVGSAEDNQEAPFEKLGQSRVAQGPVPKALAAVPGLDTAGPLTWHVVRDEARTVEVPVARLKLIQESLQRAEHAVTASLANTVEQSNKLLHERLIVMNAVDVIAGVTGEAARHYGHGSGQ